MKSSEAAEKDNKKPKINWEKVRYAMHELERRGGTVVNKHKKARTFTMPPSPGLSTLALADCLTNYGGFRREYTEEELFMLTAVRSGYNIADL